MNTPVVVALAGGTASGKTTLAARFAEQLECLRLEHDRYYHDVVDPSVHDYDHPDALDTGLMVEHLALLRRGRPAPLPVYDFKTHTRLAHTEVVHPAPIVLVEGILVLHHPELRALADLRVFVHAPDEVRLERRVARDMATRGRSRESVLHQWHRTVHPGHLGFVEPSRAHADLELDGTAPIEQLLQAFTRRVQGLLRG